MATIQHLTIPQTGRLELPADMLQALGLDAGDELIVIQTDDGVFMGSREKMLDHLLEDFALDAVDEAKAMETFLARRADLSEQLLRKHYGLGTDDLSR